METECLIRGKGGYKADMDEISCSLLEYMNNNKQLFSMLQKYPDLYEVKHIHDLHYVKSDTGEEYYTSMCELRSSISSEYSHRIKFSAKTMNVVSRKLKLDKIINNIV